MRTGSANSLIVVQRISRDSLNSEMSVSFSIGIGAVDYDSPLTIGCFLRVMAVLTLAAAFIGAGLAPQGSKSLVGNDRDHY